MKNNPMQGIKYGLAFLFGVLYASCWWAIVSFWDSAWVILPKGGIALSSVLIIARILVFFCDHW